MKIIHSADWQLGKPFARFAPTVRAALTESRFDVIDTIGAAATQAGVQHVLVAGDVFDTEGPEDRTIVHALSRMNRHTCRWWLLPGNHDFARNGGLWDRVRSRAGASVRVLTDAAPVEIEPSVWILPAPLIHRHTLDDPTHAFEQMQTPGATLRIGLAHGSIRDFGSHMESQNQIAPDRAQRANLDYLALGDWHGALQVNSRTWYSGTPETDRFHSTETGHVLMVDIQPGQEPSVTPLRTGRFTWLVRDWLTNDLPAFTAECDQFLAQTDPSTTLLQLSLAGIASMSDRIAILGRLENDIDHRLRYLDIRADDLVGRPSPDDMAALAMEGVLGAAAASLEARIAQGGQDTATAKRALERLFIEYNREDTV